MDDTGHRESDGGDLGGYLPGPMNAPKVIASTKSPGNSFKLKGIGVVVSIAITAIAIYALTHTLKSIDTNEVFEVIRHTDPSRIATAAMLVIVSYVGLTFYDLLALRTIGQTAVPYRIAALASFTSYPIAHGIGAVSLISPVIRYRIYSFHGLSVFNVVNICFLTGLTYWLGNLTALGIGLFFAPDAISLVDFLPPRVNQWIAAALLLGVGSFLIWCWFPRNVGTKRWPVRLPSGPLVLLQIVIGVFELGAAALAMYVLIPAGPNIGIFPIMAVFIAATLLGFASHTPAGIGVFDATFLIGLGKGDKEPLVAALLMFRLMYHFLPFILALSLFGLVEGWRGLRRRKLIAFSSEVETGSRSNQVCADCVHLSAVENASNQKTGTRL
jgi:glycosyltransferase 2 family protein